MKKLKALASSLLAVLACAVLGPGSWAESAGSSTFPKVAETMNREDIKPHVGLLLGLSNPEASFDTSMEYGLDIGFQPWTPMGVAFELSGLGSERMRGSESEDLNRTNLLVKGTYNLGGSTPVIRHSYLGLGLGAVIDASAYKGVHSGVAPLAGFDIPLADSRANYFSLGVGARYLFVSGPSPDSFTVAGLMKYWF